MNHCHQLVLRCCMLTKTIIRASVHLAFLSSRTQTARFLGHFSPAQSGGGNILIGFFSEKKCSDNSHLSCSAERASTFTGRGKVSSSRAGLVGTSTLGLETTRCSTFGWWWWSFMMVMMMLLVNVDDRNIACLKMKPLLFHTLTTRNYHDVVRQTYL